MAVEGFGDDPELDDEIAGEVLGLDLTALFTPQAGEGGLIIAHDDPGVRAADEITAVLLRICPHWLFHSALQKSKMSLPTGHPLRII